jgi:tetratricopeptide (TPR) repeat protein
LRNADKDEIEKNIKQIEDIEGNDGLLSRYCQVRYQIWQAQREGDKDKRRAIQAKARVLLEDLISRRADWSVIPLASAELEETELAQGDLKGDDLRKKEEVVINFYLQAIKLGQRRAAVVRRAVQLLFKTGQGDRAIELLSNIPMESQLAGVERQAATFAVENRDFQSALQIARKAVQANPGDFQERIGLIQILMASNQKAEAEKEIREAVAVAPGDPDGWITLVNFVILTKQPVEAENVIKDAQAKLPPSKAPLTLARCWDMLGRAYEGRDNAAVKRWNDAARSWYEKAQAAQPEDLSIKRRLTEFFIRSKQTDEARKYLEAITKESSGSKNAETTAWAKRALALVLANGADRERLSKALAIFEPNGEPVPAGQEGKILERKNLLDPDDLRVLARVLDLQRTLVHRKRAIEILESLAAKNLATNEDRFSAARLYGAIGDWQKAREKYGELNLRSRNVRDMETLNRRPAYLGQAITNLLEHCKPGDKEVLAEAQDYVDELKQLQPAAFVTTALQVEIHRLRNEVDQAVELIQAFAARPNLPPDTLAELAALSEKIEQPQLAEQLYNKLAALPALPRGKLLRAKFLGRQNKIKAGLDLCEPFWTKNQDIDLVLPICIDILFGSDGKRKPKAADTDRVATWIEQALKSNPQRSNHQLLAGLGNLREKQGQFPQAEQLYQRDIQEGDRDGLSLNNLAWLLAVRNDSNKAPKRTTEALDYANRAVALKPDQPEFLDTRGMVYLVGAQPKLALHDFQRAVDLDPSSPVKLFHLVQAYLANGDKEKARQTWDAAKAKGLKLDDLHTLEQPNYKSVLNALGSP